MKEIHIKGFVLISFHSSNFVRPSFMQNFIVDSTSFKPQINVTILQRFVLPPKLQTIYQIPHQPWSSLCNFKRLSL